MSENLYKTYIFKIFVEVQKMFLSSLIVESWQFFQKQFLFHFCFISFFYKWRKKICSWDLISFTNYNLEWESVRIMIKLL